MDCAVAGNKRQAGDSCLGDDHAIVGIFHSRKSGGFEKHLRVVNTQVKIICLCQSDDQIAERQWKANLACFGEE